MLTRRSFIALGSAAAALSLTPLGCKSRRDVVFGSKNFQEQWILAALLKRLITERSDRSAATKDLSGTFLCHQAMLSGDLDCYVEYTGTAFAAVLKHQPITDVKLVYQRVASDYRDKFAIEVLPPLGFDNTYAILVRRELAEAHSLKNISDLVDIAGDLRFGIGFEFYDRADGYPGLVEAYGLKLGNPPKQMKLGLIYRAIDAKAVDIIAGNSTDGLIAELDLVMLNDDKHYFPPYDAVPMIRRATLDKYPEVGDIIRSLAGTISVDAMRRANFLVDGKKLPPKQAADSLYTELGLG